MTISTMNQFNGKLRTILSITKKAHEAVQECCVYAIVIAEKDNNTDPMIKLVAAVRETKLDVRALVDYLEEHAPVRFDSDTGKFKWIKARAKENDYADYNRITWYEFKKERREAAEGDGPVFNPLRDLRSTLTSVQRKAEKASANNSEYVAKIYQRVAKTIEDALAQMEKDIKAAETQEIAANIEKAQSQNAEETPAQKAAAKKAAKVTQA